MISFKAALLGLVICLALVHWNHARGGGQAFRKQLRLLTLQKYAKDQGIDPPSQNDTNPMATIRQRLQQKIVDDYAQKLGLSNGTSADGNSTSSDSSSNSGSSNSTSNSSNSDSGSTNSTSPSSNSDSGSSNSTSNSGSSSNSESSNSGSSNSTSNSSGSDSGSSNSTSNGSSSDSSNSGSSNSTGSK